MDSLRTKEMIKLELLELCFHLFKTRFNFLFFQHLQLIMTSLMLILKETLSHR